MHAYTLITHKQATIPPHQRNTPKRLRPPKRFFLSHVCAEWKVPGYPTYICRLHAHFFPQLSVLHQYTSSSSSMSSSAPMASSASSFFEIADPPASPQAMLIHRPDSIAKADAHRSEFKEFRASQIMFDENIRDVRYRLVSGNLFDRESCCRRTVCWSRGVSLRILGRN